MDSALSKPSGPRDADSEIAATVGRERGRLLAFLERSRALAAEPVESPRSPFPGRDPRSGGEE